MINIFLFPSLMSRVADQVPILGSTSIEARSTSSSGFVRQADVAPLAGTMEDPSGRGLVPIEIGAPALDPVTG